MSTETKPAPTRQHNDTEPMVHTYCHNPDKALCGEDLRGGDDTEAAAECVVCRDLAEQGLPCSRLCNVRGFASWWLWRRWRE